MKRFLSVIMACSFVFSFAGITAQADIVGEVIATDITAYIDEQPISSYNINDYTYVIAEDLRDYGFAVKWSEAARELRIYRKTDYPKWFLSAEKLNVKKSDVNRGAHAFDVYSTNIVTYLEDEPITAFNVDGQTLIQIDELTRYGYFSYDDERREVKINMAAFYADQLYDMSAKETLLLPCDKIEGTITYSGDVKDGKPNGYGRVTEEYEFTNGLASTDRYVYTAKFVDGVPDGPLFYFGTHIPHNGSDRRVRDYYKIEHYKDGVLDGYFLSVTQYDDGYSTRTEAVYENGAQIFSRVTETDDTYRYGYKVISEGYLDALGNMIDYKPIEAGKIVAVSAGYSGGYAIDENGVLFGFGETVRGTKTVPVKLDETVSFAAGDSAGLSSVIDREGNLYYLYDKLVTYNNTDVSVAAENVKAASDNFFLTSDGNLYEKPTDYNWTWYDQPKLIDSGVSSFSARGQMVLYLKDNSVYYGRVERPGVSWNDGLTIPTPVKVFENAKSASLGSRFLVVDENNTLWGWSSQLYGTPYEGQDDDIFSTFAPIQIADDVAFADSGTGFLAYVKTDGSLWVMPDVTEPEGEMLFDLKEPVKLSENVKTISCGGSFLLFATNDGRLFSWGKNSGGRLGNGSREDATEPFFIQNFYAFR